MSRGAHLGSTGSHGENRWPLPVVISEPLRFPLALAQASSSPSSAYYFLFCLINGGEECFSKHSKGNKRRLKRMYGSELHLRRAEQRIITCQMERVSNYL